MTGCTVKGWCPDAWRPMMAGDGLLVRVKPRLGRLTRAQALGLCDAAMAHGNGLIDLTRRANLQIRGVSEQGWQRLLDRLLAQGLVHPDPAIEQRRNLLLPPDCRTGDDSHRIACDLLDRLDELPDLPGKTGFVIDAGQACVLRDEAGDFRIERGAGGGLSCGAEDGIRAPRSLPARRPTRWSRWPAGSWQVAAPMSAAWHGTMPLFPAGPMAMFRRGRPLPASCRERMT